MFIHILTLLIALAISAIAGLFSVIGIALIFSGSYWSAIALGTALEVGKIISVSWLYRNWSHATFLLRTYLIIAIVTLSTITSLGIFGYLSRAHLEQEASIENGAQSQIELVDIKIAQQKDAVRDVDQRISIIDSALEQLIKTNKSVTSFRLGDQSRKNRDALITEKNKDIAEINDLQLQKNKLQNEDRKTQLEVGPIKYVSQLIFSNSDQATLEKAVRGMIIIIVLVFDPLAISLIIAANSGFAHRKLLTTAIDPDMMHIHSKHIKEIQ